MQLAIQLFARAKDLAGNSIIRVTLPDDALVADLRTALAEQHPQLKPLIPHLLVAIGTDYANDAARLSSTSCVSCFPPVSGG